MMVAEMVFATVVNWAGPKAERRVGRWAACSVGETAAC